MPLFDEAVGLVDKLYGVVLRATADVAALRDRHAVEKICISLRKIYFTPDGILLQLKKISNGESINRNVFEQELKDLSDSECQVSLALEHLEDKRVLHDLRIPIGESDILMAIRYDKFRLRREIFRVFGVGVDLLSNECKSEAQSLVGELERLNGLIREVDVHLNPNRGGE